MTDLKSFLFRLQMISSDKQEKRIGNKILDLGTESEVTVDTHCGTDSGLDF